MRPAHGFLGVFLLGCTGLVVAPGDDPGSAEETGGPPSSPDPARPATSDVGKPSVPGAPPAGRGPVRPAETPLRRLSRAELVASVKDVFPEVTFPVAVDGLPQDELVVGFTGQSHDLLTDTKLEQYVQVLGEVARAVAAGGDQFVAPCKRSEKGDVACVAEALGRRLPRIWRRPTRADEQKALVEGLFAPLAREHGFAAALEALVLRTLLSPSFLFKIERGTPAGSNRFRLDDHEVANRLSYFLWRAPPDAELAALAAQGRLRDPALLRAQAQRLMAAPRAADTFQTFHLEWLRLQGLVERTKPKEQYPKWSDAVRDAALKETVRLGEHVSRSGAAPWTDLLTARYGFVDAGLASLYAVPKPASGFARVEFPDRRRSGVLTQASFLAAHSHAEESQMIHRGLAVREYLLCQEVPPPVNVDVTARVDRLTTAACAGCHIPMEGLGVGFESYDGIGQWRDRLARGRLTGISGAEAGVEFDTVDELGQRLAQAPEARACFARQWLRFSLGRHEDDAEVAPLAAALASDGRVPALVAALVTSDAFLHRDERPTGACN